MKRTVEFTFGVCVPVTFDDDTGEGIVLGEAHLTESGLFSDAVEGAWEEAEGAWTDDVPPQAASLAQRKVRNLLGK